MIIEYAISLGSAIIALGIGICIIRVIRKRLTPEFPVSAIGASIAVVATSLLFTAQFVGLDVAFLFPGILAVVTFVGAIAVQRAPWNPASILCALAISAGCIALVAALTLNYSAAALALLATGVLVKLYCDVSPRRNSLTEEVRSNARAA